MNADTTAHISNSIHTTSLCCKMEIFLFFHKSPMYTNQCLHPMIAKWNVRNGKQVPIECCIDTGSENHGRMPEML